MELMSTGDRCCMAFQALGNRNRLRIMVLIKEGEMCVSDICAHFRMRQPSVSHHLDMLKRAGLVTSEKRGREVYYRMNEKAILECCGRQLRAFDIIVRQA